MIKDWKYGVLENAVKKGSSNISLNKIKDDEGEYPLFSAKGFSKNISFFQQEKEYIGIIKDGAGIGRVSKYPANSSIVATMQYLIPKEGFDIGFIEYFLNGIDFEKHRNGSTIPHIYFKDYKSEPFPILPISEQKRIVSILDSAFAAIDKAKANAEQNLKNAKELFESYLQAVFDNGKLKVESGEWDEKKLDEVCDIKTGKLNANAMVENGKYPFFTCSREIFSINDYAFDCNAVLLAGNNASGDFNVKIYNGKFNAYQRTYIITTNNQFKLELLKYKLENHLGELKKQSVGANTKFLKLGMIKDILLNYPKSIDEQKQIVQKLDALSAKTKKLEVIYQQKIDNLTELKKSILQKAFSGQLIN